jgi:hypothetical protein
MVNNNTGNIDQSSEQMPLRAVPVLFHFRNEAYRTKIKNGYQYPVK